MLSRTGHKAGLFFTASTWSTMVVAVCHSTCSLQEVDARQPGHGSDDRASRDPASAQTDGRRIQSYNGYACICWAFRIGVSSAAMKGGL